MDNQFKPQDNIIKQNLEELIPLYTELKHDFFLTATKNDNEEYHEAAANAYEALIHTLYTLLELIKPDNTQTLGILTHIQQRLETLDKQTTITDQTIEELRTLTTWADTQPLSPYLRTLKPILHI
jgi:hypothetical protein